MKIKLLIIAFFLSAPFYSQLHEVSGGNVGVSLNAGIVKNSPVGSGFGFNGGITTSFRELIFPEVSFGYQSESYGFDSLSNEILNVSNNLGLSLNSKIPIWDISLGKSSKGECWHLLLKVLFDYKYSLMLRQVSTFDFDKQNNHGLNLGVGFRPAYSGGHKSRVAWSYFYDVYYHLDLNKNNQMALQQDGWKQNGLYFRLTILHYKTSDFLNNGIDKKKAYKRTY